MRPPALPLEPVGADWETFVVLFNSGVKVPMGSNRETLIKFKRDVVARKDCAIGINGNVIVINQVAAVLNK